MPRKLRVLRGDLWRAGFSLDHQTGSHQVWKHPLLPGISANLAGKDGDDAKPYQEREVREALRRLDEAKQRQQP
jgi:predicted RNA binding protein YcfA (HicA-like mRNA interferase family)